MLSVPMLSNKRLGSRHQGIKEGENDVFTTDGEMTEQQSKKENYK